jgi:hypothetical protein
VRDGHDAVDMTLKILGFYCFASPDYGAGAAHVCFYYTPDAYIFYLVHCAIARGEYDWWAQWIVSMYLPD